VTLLPYQNVTSGNCVFQNFGKEYVELFFVHYGIDDIDYKKIRFYQLVEKFV